MIRAWLKFWWPFLAFAVVVVAIMSFGFAVKIGEHRDEARADDACRDACTPYRFQRNWSPSGRERCYCAADRDAWQPTDGGTP